MIYSLVVLASPVSGHASRHALAFAQGVLDRGHAIRRVFFLDAGTVTSANGVVVPQDEADPVTPWSGLARQHAVELVVCVTSALRYGMLDDAEARRYERPAATISDGFVIAGLGDLVDACANADRVVTFGG